jgi:hypothetical protein
VKELCIPKNEHHMTLIGTARSGRGKYKILKNNDVIMQHRFDGGGINRVIVSGSNAAQENNLQHKR